MATSFIGQTGLPVGLLNNNPGDFKSDINWQGTIGTNGDFWVFKDISWGLRALALDIINNINKGVDTITLFITKYAPPSENPTAAYIANVSSFMGIDPDDQLGTDSDTVSSLMRAIMNQELDANYSAMIADSDIDNGISMATSGVATLPAAAVIAIQANPGASLVGLGVVAFLLFSVFGGSKGSKDA
jgi:hypothetical protein